MIRLTVFTVHYLKNAGDNITDKLDLRSMNTLELSALLESMGEPKFRAKQLFKWLQSGVKDFDGMTNIPKKLRNALSEKGYIANVKIVKRCKSRLDETVKYVYELNDGEYIESVLMKYEHGYTVCISTQVGCRMGCKFCASGLFGLTRNLTASEMLAQLMAAQKDNNIRVSNVVMMGMGEPLDNFENSIKFLQLVSDDSGMNIGLRHISLSTCGVVSKLKNLAEYNMPITLSVSLHAPNDAIRDIMMPINKKWNVAELLAGCKEYQKVTTRRISFEYALIENVNDSVECANELVKRLKGIMCHVNLIPANPVKENSFKKSNRDNIIRFKNILESRGLTVTIRRTLGADISASCGQLRKKVKEGGEV